MIDKTNPAYAGKLVVGLVAAQLMKIPNVVLVLLAFTAIDYGTGLLAAWSRKDWSSDVGRRGLVKKALTFALILTLGILQRLMVTLHVPGFEGDGLLSKIDLVNVMSVLYILNEVISIIENCAGVGVPIPARIVQALVAAKRYQMRSATKAELAELAKQDGGEEDPPAK